MPTASRESSRSRRSRSNSKAKSPPPQKTPSQSQKKVNGVKNNSTPKSTKETSPKIPKDPKLYDLYADAACKLCDKKNFKLGTDALVKHYALEHFREKLEVDQKDFSCNVCKNKKLKSKFDSKQDILIHNATFHFKAQYLLAEALGEKSSISSKTPNNTRSARIRNRDREKQSGPGPGPGKSEEISNDSVIEIESTSGSSEGGDQNGLEELSKSSDASDKSTDIDDEIEEIEEVKDEDDEIEFKPNNEVLLILTI